MSNYSAIFKLTLSDTVKDIAVKVGKGFDPDSGGEYSFSSTSEGIISTSTPCDAEFKATADYLMTNPEALHYALTQKYSERWADLEPPTLEECILFIAAIIPEVEVPLSTNSNL